MGVTSRIRISQVTRWRKALRRNLVRLTSPAPFAHISPYTIAIDHIANEFLAFPNRQQASGRQVRAPEFHAATPGTILKSQKTINVYVS